MRRLQLLASFSLGPLICPCFAQTLPAAATWTFAVSGDSRNCGDFVMPVIARHVQEEGDAFYWHLGDFRAIFEVDQDLASMEPAASKRTLEEYREIAWDDFLQHQMAAFGDTPVFLGRGNHEVIPPMTRDRYIAKFSGFLNRPEIVAQDRQDSKGSEEKKSTPGVAPRSSPWYHFVRDGIDFITLDNSSSDEFSNAQLTWLRAVLDRDLASGSGVRTILAGMHEALPHSTSFSHGMDDWQLGVATGEDVYRWFASAQKAGKHVYLLASHSHFYSPDIYNTAFWQKEGIVLPGVIIGSAGAQRYKLPDGAAQGSLTHRYGYLQATAHADGTIDFVFHEILKQEMESARWPGAPMDAVDECFEHNAQKGAER